MGIILIEGNAEDKGYILASNVRISFRELQMLLLLARGQEQEDIAKIFDLSINTVRNHIYNIMKKLGAKNRSQAIIKAIENGMFKVTTNKDLVGWLPEDYAWCWNCGKVFTINEMAQKYNEPIEINHVIVEVPPDNICPYCNADFDDACLWDNLVKYNTDLPKFPDKNKEYSNLDFISIYDMKPDTTRTTHNNVINNKIGRNAICPCGSGKKYKKCCGFFS